MKINRPRAQHAVAAASAGLALLATCAYAAAAGSRIGPPGPVTLHPPGVSPRNPAVGPPAALALLSRVQHEYRHTAGVELDAAGASPTNVQGRRFLLQLHNGIATAQAFIGPRRLALVARSGGPTFMRAAHEHCWRRLAASDTRAFLDVGVPFPENGKLLVRRNARARKLTIEAHSGFWFLAGPVTPPTLVYKSFLRLTLDPATDAIRSIGVRTPDHAVRARLTVTPLPTAPEIPRPTPAC